MPSFTLEERQIRYIHLNDLMVSPRNVRQDDAPIDDLLGSIPAHGLLKNLVVIPGAGARSRAYDVVAGGRRLRALKALSSEGRLPEGLSEVPCLVLRPDANLEEISLAENVGHNPMHPADEFEAFAALAKNEIGIEEISARFGKSPRYVEQRLRLGNIAPSIMKLYRADEIELSQVMALALTEDHATQEKVWKAARLEWQQEPRRLREAIADKELSVEGDPVAAFLGVADYEKGGGVARRDLFGDEKDAWLPDAKLARSLANEKMQKLAKKLREAEGWLWVEPRLAFNSQDLHKFSLYGGGYIWDAERKTNWPEKAKQYAGAIVALNQQGEVTYWRGLLKPEDAKRLAGEEKAKAKNKKSTAAAKPAKKPGELSFAQVQRLQGDRTAVLRAELATKPRIALAALAADLFADADLGEVRMLKAYDYEREPVVHIRADRQYDGGTNIREAIGAHPRTEAIEKLEKEWLARLKPAKGKLFAWLLEQPESLTHELLGFLAARTIVAGENFDKGSDRGREFAVTAGIDMVDHWTPTEAWLSAQPKGVIVAAVTEACGKKAAAELEKMKKPLAAARAEALLRDTQWIPKPLRAPAPKKKAAQAATKVELPKPVKAAKATKKTAKPAR